MHPGKAHALLRDAGQPEIPSQVDWQNPCSKGTVLFWGEGREDASAGCRAPSRKPRVLTHAELVQLHPPPLFAEAALMSRNLL